MRLLPHEVFPHTAKSPVSQSASKEYPALEVLPLSIGMSEGGHFFARKEPFSRLIFC